MPNLKTDFCGECGSLLDISSIKSTQNCVCQICGWEVDRDELAGKTIVTKSKLGAPRTEEDEIEVQSNGIVINEKCPQCSQTGLYFTTAQTRSADEGSTIFYKCRNCGHRFTHNN